MSWPWWDDPSAEAVLDGDRPVLLPGGRSEAIARLQRRIAGFTPEWRDLSEEDAGVALARLFGLQFEPVVARLEKLPDKVLREFLSVAGITLSSPRAAQTRIAFTPKETNAEPVEVPKGVKLRSAPADDSDTDVTWETQAPLRVANCTLAQVLNFDGEFAVEIGEGSAFAPFSPNSPVGSALYLGFAGVGDLSGLLALGVTLTNDEIALPVALGGSEPSQDSPPRLVWEYSGARGFAAAPVESDDTAQFTKDGIVQLDLPSGWQASRPDTLGEGESLFWLRLRLAAGTPAKSALLSSITPHVVRAAAQESYRNEFPIAEGGGPGKTARLAQTPVVSDALVVEVDEGASPVDLFAIPSGELDDRSGGAWRQWERVETLAGQSADARVFELDPLTGVITFGDGINGAALPAGVRGIAVRSYAVTSGAAGNVAPGMVDRMVRNLAGIDEVSNIDPGEGGANTESIATAERRGPGEIKARGRAVTAGDMQLLAESTPGANILRAFAHPGVDPAYPDAEIAGTVGIFVMAERHPSAPAATPPYASSAALKAVATHIPQSVGPAGARAAVGNPAYQEVSVEGIVVLKPGSDAQLIGSLIRSELDAWLDPQTEHPDYGWWALGDELRHADLNHLVLSVDAAILAAPYLSLRVDGIASEPCGNVSLHRFALPWPAAHSLRIEIEGEAS